MNGPIFSLSRVGKRYGDFAALDEISFSIEPGERVVLIGPSGAGKSTLLGLLNGTLAPSQGEVMALGRSLTGLSPKERRAIQRRIGTIYQQYQLVDSLPVIHNVNAGHLGRWSLGKALLSLVWPLERARAADALGKVGIPEKLYARTSSLSGGQQQRVALARVLVQNPDAILADEPIASLDPERAREMMDLLAAISQQTRKTLVASLHAVEFTRSHFDRVIGLRGGQVLFDCPADGVDEGMLGALYRL